MCGIAGYFGRDELQPERIESCLRGMRRRGPDHAAHRHWQTASGMHCHLLHTRLSIIDLDPRSHQPIGVGTKWLAFNGELYNYLELRRELGGRGFRTESDTEVLLRAIDRYGWDALDRCEGMWAFAVFDEADGTLTLCRDRFGEKPVYLLRTPNGLFFGSEVKCLVALLGHRLDVDVDHMYRYLVNGYKALYKQPRTFFKGLEELPPATWIRIDADGAETRHRYWAPRFDPDESQTYEDAVRGARDLIVRSVELRLRADVPLAFCMSGGVDSVSLISVAKRMLDFDVHGFTIVNTDERYEEQELVTRAVSELGIRHTSIPIITTGFLPRLRELVRYHDAPVYTITYFAHWLLMESIAGHGYRIAISGTAADELFTGYFDHHLAYLYEVRHDPDLLAASRRAWAENVRPHVRNPHLRNPDLFVADPAFRDHIFLEAEVFAGRLRHPWHEPFAETVYTDSLLRNRMLNEMFHEAVPVILHEDDLNAMYFSIENRSPYLDRHLFEFCYRIPSRHLVQRGLAKAVLRDAMAGIAPSCVLESARKVGFNAPIAGFLDVNDPDTRSYLLDGGPIFEHVDRSSIEQLIDKADLPNSESKFLFYFLNAKIFLEEAAA